MRVGQNPERPGVLLSGVAVRTCLVLFFWFGLFALVCATVSCRGCSRDRKGSVWTKIDIGEQKEESAKSKESPSAKATEESTSPTSGIQAPSGEEFSFDFSPKGLRVYRATDVTFWVTHIPSGERPTKLDWEFDDDLTKLQGEEVTYTFEGGLRDRNVTATLHYPSGREVRVVRTVPLDKIPSSERKKDSTTKPVPGIEDFPNGLRAVFVGSLKNNLELADKVQRILDLDPQILFVLGDLGKPSVGKGWDSVRRDLIIPAQARGVWVCPIPGRSDLLKGRKAMLKEFWEDHRPTLNLSPGSEFPESYAFRRDGVFFATLKTGAKNSDEEILRIQSVLGRAQADPSRVVVSYLPLAPLTEKDDGHLEKAYRFYEVLERSATAALVSGHYGITYLGQYGGLKTFSAGRVSDDCDLLPTGQCTPEAAVVMDFSRGKLKRAFAVALDSPPTIFDTEELPSVLFNYRRWDPKLP